MARFISNKLFRRVSWITKKVYWKLENAAAFDVRKRKNVYLYAEIKKMNELMKKFYKRPKLEINGNANVLPVKFETEDGVVISGIQYITDPNSKKWIIANHWFGGHKYWGLYWARPFIELGYNVLAFDYRNHGDSEDQHYTTMGILEVKDLMSALKWLYENHDYETLGLIGTSMGGFTINYATVKYPELIKKYKVTFAVSEVAYGSIRSLLLHTRKTWLKHVVKQHKTKNIIERIIADQIEDTGLDWNELDVFKYYEEKNVKPTFPIFYSHGRNDKVTPPIDSNRMYTARTKLGMKDDELLIYDYSAHCFSLPKHFHQTIYHWLRFENKIVGDDEATLKAYKYFGIDQNLLDNDFYERDEIVTYWSEPKSELTLLKGDKKDAKEIK